MNRIKLIKESLYEDINNCSNVNRPEYRYYIVNAREQKIIEGFEYKEDAQNSIKSYTVDYPVLLIITLRDLLSPKFDLDPSDPNNWVCNDIDSALNEYEDDEEIDDEDYDDDDEEEVEDRIEKLNYNRRKEELNKEIEDDNTSLDNDVVNANQVQLFDDIPSSEEFMDNNMNVLASALNNELLKPEPDRYFIKFKFKKSKANKKYENKVLKGIPISKVNDNNYVFNIGKNEMKIVNLNDIILEQKRASGKKIND